MKIFKQLYFIGLIFILSMVLAACGSSSNDKEEKASSDDTQEIEYNGDTYEVPEKIDKIAIASLESMEDAAILGVKPAAAVTVGGEIPDYLDMDLEGVEPVGERKEPSYEALLNVDPDVITWTTKSPEEVTQQLEKVATTFPYSHFSSDWDENLRLMAKLSGKEDKAEEIIDDYNDKLAETKETLDKKLDNDDEVIMIRIREGNIFVYSDDVYYNPFLYDELELTVPKAVEDAEAQEMISLEKFAEMDPDYIFVQFSEDENADDPEALKKLEDDPIWKSMKAVKEDHVYVNAVDNLAQGGTAWSKLSFMDAMNETIAK